MIHTDYYNKYNGQGEKIIADCMDQIYWIFDRIKSDGYSIPIDTYNIGIILIFDTTNSAIAYIDLSTAKEDIREKKLNQII